jgi:hypothetical protein
MTFINKKIDEFLKRFLKNAANGGGMTMGGKYGVPRSPVFWNDKDITGVHPNKSEIEKLRKDSKKKKK